jgi:N-acetylmuramoyl-L-alanine amidase
MKILLDAGHYGKYNQSPHLKAYYESERMWILMRFLQQELEKRGHLVHTTREQQSVDLAVTERGKLAAGHDLFISLHTNDFTGSDDLERAKKVDYVVAFVPSYAKNTRCEKSASLGLKLAQAIKTFISSVDYARTFTYLNDSGNEYYGVLRGWQYTDCPLGMIIEHGFHSNPYTASLFMDDYNLLELAKLEAEIIDTFLKEN